MAVQNNHFSNQWKSFRNTPCPLTGSSELSALCTTGVPAIYLTRGAPNLMYVDCERCGLTWTREMENPTPILKEPSPRWEVSSESLVYLLLVSFLAGAVCMFTGLLILRWIG